MKNTPWIKKFYNDKRDYIVAEHQIEIPTVEIETGPPEYEFNRKYEVVLVEDRDDVSGEVSYYWIEETKQKIIGPKFPNQQLAQYWMSQNEK